MRNGTPGFQGTRLAEARDSRGLTQVALADLIGRTSPSISRWEAGDQSPEPEALSKLAQALAVPTGFFLRAQPDHGPAPMFFRSMASTTQAARRRARARLRWVQDIALALQEWVDLPDVDVPRLGAADYRDIRDEDIERAAADCRERWELGVGPVADVLLVMENAGICAVREEVGTATMDGLSNWSAADGRPYVLIAADKATCFRSRLDAAHELAHLVLHGDLRGVALGDTAAFKEIERQAFRFAGAFLLPAESFGAEVLSPSLTALLALKERWKVSVGAMVKRCDDLGMMSEEFARRTWTHYGARGWRKAEPLDDALEPEAPRLLGRSVRLLLDEGVRTRADLESDFRLLANDIESLCGLPRGFIGGGEATVTRLPQLKQREPGAVPSAAGVVVPFQRH
ncbi:MAG: XRE family transcriptional regulator [Acetobacteraceae bacterium]|nr:XRE family transcriptional regulator [Acetobacteraceae bacterium]